ncbi:MAG: hypothetical protein WAV31_01630 [Candidatus Moraniibacteriota bacterium]
MKNKLTISIGIFLLLFLAGCTFGGAGSTSSSMDSQKYTFSKSLWLSRDGGKTWQASNTSNNKPKSSDVNSYRLVFDKKNINIAYAGLLTGGIIKTIDGGTSWDFLDFGAASVYGLALDPVDTNIVYASAVLAGRGKIAKSVDGGANWDEIYTFAAKGPMIIYLVTDGHNTGVVYASTSDNQLIKSVDGGVSWKNIFQAKSAVSRIVVDSINSNMIYLLTKSGDIFYSSNSGNSFDSLTGNLTTTGMFGSDFSVIEADPSHTGWLYLAGKKGIIRTKDAGKTWEKVVVLNNPSNSPIGALAINPADSRQIFYGALQATYKSLDDGKTWTTSQFDLTKGINMLKYNPLDPNMIIATFVGK